MPRAAVRTIRLGSRGTVYTKQPRLITKAAVFSRSCPRRPLNSSADERSPGWWSPDVRPQTNAGAGVPIPSRSLYGTGSTRDAVEKRGAWSTVWLTGPRRACRCRKKSAADGTGTTWRAHESKGQQVRGAADAVLFLARSFLPATPGRKAERAKPCLDAAREGEQTNMRFWDCKSRRPDGLMPEVARLSPVIISVSQMRIAALRRCRRR